MPSLRLAASPAHIASVHAAGQVVGILGHGPASKMTGEASKSTVTSSDSGWLW